MVDLFDYQGKWEKLVDKAISSGYESLSANEKVGLNVQYLTDSIRNGGLISYYYNSPADTIEDCQKALDVLGVANMKYLIEQMNRLFPGGVPKDITVRNQIINTLTALYILWHISKNPIIHPALRPARLSVMKAQIWKRLIFA